jgi:hypothetical protein
MVFYLPMLRYFILSIDSFKTLTCCSYKVAEILPSKTIPSTGHSSSAKHKRLKQSKHTTTNEEPKVVHNYNNKSGSKGEGKSAMKAMVCSPQNIVDQT